jgi:hypothetical protein
MHGTLVELNKLHGGRRRFSARERLDARDGVASVDVLG